MIQSILKELKDLSFFNWLDLIGFVLTLLGFYVTYKAVKKAGVAVAEARADIHRSDMIVDTASAISIMEEIKRLFRIGRALDVLERLSALRKCLISIRVLKTDSKEDSDAIQSIMAQLAVLESVAEASIRDDVPLNQVKLSVNMSKQVDVLYDMLVRVQSKMGA